MPPNYISSRTNKNNSRLHPFVFCIWRCGAGCGWSHCSLEEWVGISLTQVKLWFYISISYKMAPEHGHSTCWFQKKIYNHSLHLSHFLSGFLKVLTVFSLICLQVWQSYDIWDQTISQTGYWIQKDMTSSKARNISRWKTFVPSYLFHVQ